MRMLNAAYGTRVHPDTLKEIRKHVQTDHINSRLCDDPVNFFLLLDTVNSKFGYERLMNYKKKFMGDAWAGVVYMWGAELQWLTRPTASARAQKIVRPIHVHLDHAQFQAQRVVR